MASECRHRVRFTLSDESGALRFKDFRILSPSQCATAETIQKYLVDAELDGLNWEFIRQLSRDSHCTCGGDVLQVLDDCRRLFTHAHKGSTVQSGL